MAAQPTAIVTQPSSSTDLLDLVTRFSKEMGAITDVGALSNRIIEELCRAVAATQGALYLLDREHEWYRRAGTAGPAADSFFPVTLPLTHPITYHPSVT